mgnify:CR=1 FL=1
MGDFSQNYRKIQNFIVYLPTNLVIKIEICKKISKKIPQ